MPTTDTRQDIKVSLLQAIRDIADNYEGLILAAIYISFDKDFGQIRIHRIDQESDEEINIFTNKITPWNDSSELDRHIVYARLEDIVNELNNENAFYPIRRYTPFDILYTDKQSNTCERILSVSGDDGMGSAASLFDDIVDLFGGVF